MPTFSFQAAVLAVAVCCGSTAASRIAAAEDKSAPQPSAAKQPVENDKRAPPIADAKEMLELFGVDESKLRAFRDGRPIGPDEEEALWRMLFAARRFGAAEVQRWTHPEKDVGRLSAHPEEFRGEIIEFEGRATNLTIEKPLPEVVERFDLPKFYRCELAIGEERLPATVYALAVPKAWRADQPMNERASVRGFFIKLAGDEGAWRRPVFVAQRVAWYPDDELGDLKMDAGLFDELSPRPEVAAEDRECFYQLLAAAGRTSAQELLRRTPRNSPVAPLFNQPKAQQGKLLALFGTARQALLRRVEDPDIVARFGIDHYYEIELDTPDSQNNPITFCVRELPPGFPKGERIFETVRIAGFYMKKWGYRVDAPIPPNADQAGADQAAAGQPADRGDLVRRQLAPLLIGREPLWIPPIKPDTSWTTTSFALAFVGGIFVLWLVVWRLGRGDDRFHKQVVRKAALEEGRSLNDLDLEDAGPPRFG
ncbi:MAG TPA: hypothetical protein VGN42_19585 [Pirellulales bacterium]|nr:hypothetical protein [Pirellulales bacterium]